MSVFSSLLRMNGIKYVSDDEKREAHRIGAGKAKEIYEPMYERVVKAYEMLDSISKEKKENYETRKKEFITEFTTLKSRNKSLEKRCAAAGFKITSGGANIMSSLTAFSALNTVNFLPVGKKDVPAYREAMEEGFKKTKKIFEKKLEDMNKKINKILEDIAEFDIMKDKIFAEAVKWIAEEEIRGQYYTLLLRSEEYK